MTIGEVLVVLATLVGGWRWVTVSDFGGNREFRDGR